MNATHVCTRLIIIVIVIITASQSYSLKVSKFQLNVNKIRKQKTLTSRNVMNQSSGSKDNIIVESTSTNDDNIVSQGIDKTAIQGYISSDLNSLDNNKQWRVFGKLHHCYVVVKIVSIINS